MNVLRVRSVLGQKRLKRAKKTLSLQSLLCRNCTVARSPMSGFKRLVVAGLISASALGCLAALRSPLMPRVEIRGAFSRSDIAEITHLHHLVCPNVSPAIYLKWFPTSLQRQISVALNPIDIIALPKDGEAIVVYRGFNNYYYDKKGKHRFGTASYTLAKGTNGWHEVFLFP